MPPEIKLNLSSLHKFLPENDQWDIPSTPKSLPPEVEKFEVFPKDYANYALRLVAAYCRSLKDALELYHPLPSIKRFHESMTRIRLVNGSNQAGKTLCSMIEFARIIRGKDPFKKRSNRDLVTLSVGKDMKHVGQVMWKKLWFPGAFEIVPDEVDGFWRAVRPDPMNPRQIDPIDTARKSLWRPAPSLLPPESIKQISWEQKAESIPSLVTLTNGTESWFSTSNGDPRNGIQIDLAHFDEEILNKAWLPETMPRLVARNGIFIWSYTPQASTPQAFELHRRAQAGDPYVEEFLLLIDDNPYFSEEAKRALYADLAALGDEELAVRWYGNHAIHGRSVYPTYDLREQGCDPFEIPDHWMRVAMFDPGSSVAAVLLGAVPPEANAIYVYGEIVCKNKDADYLAAEFKRVAGHHVFEAYVMDKKAGQQRSMGRTNTVADHYTEAFQKAGIRPSRLSGMGFIFGCSDCDAREQSVKRMLNSNRIRFMRGKTNALDRQIKNRYRDKNNPERRESRTEHDLCDDLEYMAAFFDDTGLYYNAPVKPKSAEISKVGRRIMSAFDDFKAGPNRRRRTPIGSVRLAS